MRYSIDYADQFEYAKQKGILATRDPVDVGIAAIPFFIGLVKLSGGLLTEIVNMVLICSSFTCQDVTKDFVAMIVLAEVDNILVGILIESSCISDFGENPVLYDRTRN